MFSNTAQTQWDVHNSISHSAFIVLNILTGIGYIKEWWPHIIRITYTFLILQIPECIQPKQSLAPPPPTPSIHYNFSQPPTHPLLLPGTGSTFCYDSRLPQHRSIASVISSKTLKIFPSLPVNNQLWVQAADNIALWKTRITTKLTLILLMWRIWWAPNNASRWQVGFNSAYKGQSTTIKHCVLSNICDCCAVKSVYTDIPLFWDRTPCHSVHFQAISRNHPHFIQPECSLTLKYSQQVKYHQHVTMSNFEIISHTLHMQKLHSYSKC